MGKPTEVAKKLNLICGICGWKFQTIKTEKDLEEGTIFCPQCDLNDPQIIGYDPELLQ